MMEATKGSYSETDFAELEARISEIEQLLRYHNSIACGASQKHANMAFEI